MPTKDDFINEIQSQFMEAKAIGAQYVDIVSGDVHRKLGGYPGKSHRMKTCCMAMYELMKANDEILHAPESTYGATVEIRYYL